ncbi:MAG: hypothetical protein ACYC36_02455 [Bellilinea sp.]
MSYSFQIRAATKAEAKDRIFLKLAEVCAAQPAHLPDSKVAFESAAELINMVADDTSRDIVVDMSGSTGSNDTHVLQVNTNINVMLADKK